MNIIDASRKRKKTEDQRQVTHSRLDSGVLGRGEGKFHVPDDRYSEFLQMYAQDVDMGYLHYLQEAPTGVMRVFAEVHAERASDDRLLEYASIYQQVVSSFYPGAPSHMLREVIALDKRGMHVHLPEIAATDEQLRQLRYSFVLALEEKYGPKDWDDVVDAAVYTKGALRMLGSYMAELCSHCTGEDGVKGNCGNCVGAGWQHIPVCYQVAYVFDGLGMLDDQETAKMQGHTLYALQQTAIRLPAGTPANPFFCAATLAPLVREQQDKKLGRGEKPPKKWEEWMTEAQRALVHTYRHKALLDKAKYRPVYKRVQQVLRLNSHYCKLFVHHIFKVVSSPAVPEAFVKYIITVRGTGERYCKNICADHDTETVYFTLSHDGIRQKCLCPDDDVTKRPGGRLCSEFVSSPMDMFPSLSKMLYPNMCINGKTGSFKQDERDRLKDQLAIVELRRITGIRDEAPALLTLFEW